LITLDSSAIFALLDAKSAEHSRTRAALREERPPFLIPAGILAEIAYLVEARLGERVLDAFLADLENHRFTLDCGGEDLGFVRRLCTRYADLPLGFADASVIACAERSGGRVLTLDRRDFEVIAREIRITLLPD
jgi:uncharacterized protein